MAGVAGVLGVASTSNVLATLERTRSATMAPLYVGQAVPLVGVGRQGDE